MKAEISELIGKTIGSIEQTKNQITFTIMSQKHAGLREKHSMPEKYRMFHAQDCCEHVEIEDICGNLNDLIGTPILKAEKVSNYNPDSKADKKFAEESTQYMGTHTWTFYKLATINGYVDIRWFGTSSGCYSEGVDFAKTDKEGKFFKFEESVML